jgi:hypothetical protein
MHRNRLWLAFLSCFAIALLVYSSITLYRLYSYIRLDAHATAQTISWQVAEIEEDLFAAGATYTFPVGDQLIEGYDHLRKPIYYNRWAAESSLISNESADKTIWYRSSDPSVSSLQKSFPLKESIYTIILLALLLYFIWLGYYVSRFSPQR